MDIPGGVLGGGISGVVVAGIYFAYKCCYRRKLRSKCCGAELDVGAGAGEPSTPAAAEEERVATVPIAPTPKPSPHLTAANKEQEVPELKV